MSDPKEKESGFMFGSDFIEHYERERQEDEFCQGMAISPSMKQDITEEIEQQERDAYGMGGNKFRDD